MVIVQQPGKPIIGLELLVEQSRPFPRSNTELLPQGLAASRKLADRARPVSRLITQSHEPPMGPFMSPIVAKQKLSVDDTLLGAACRLIIGKKPLEQREIESLQSLAFVSAPILIAAFEEVPSVEGNDAREFGGISIVESFPRCELHSRLSILQLRNIKP